MDQKTRKEAYLASAKAADKHAAEAQNSLARAAWLKIAESYRDMATHARE